MPVTRHIYAWYFRHYCKDFTKFIFPLIKNISPSLMTSDLVKIQPMNLPSGNIFYMDLIYKKKKWWQFWKKDYIEPDESHIPVIPYNEDDYKDYPDFIDWKE